MIPLRARLNFWRQRIVLTVRWVFRLPVDDIRDRQLATMVQTLERESEALATACDLMKSIESRLRYYEEHIPRMRELKRSLELEEIGLKPKTNGALHKIELIKP